MGSSDISVQHNVQDLNLLKVVQSYAKQYKVNADHMWNTIKCEDPTLDPLIQSQIFKDGKQEESYGIAQINLPAHKDITKSQAQDLDFSLNFMAKQFSLGNAHMWSCWRKLYE